MRYSEKSSQIYRNENNGGCHGLRGKGATESYCLMGYIALILEDKDSSRNWLQNNGNVLNITELYT